MKKVLITLIHQIVHRLSLENLIYHMGGTRAIFWKFIPPPSFYRGKKRHLISRNGARFLINRADYMQWHIFTGLPDNSWKPATARLQKSNAQNHLHVFDVGANCGAFTLKLAAWCYKKGLSHVTIHAFEPNPNVVQVLTENIELNPTLKSIIQIHPFGLGAANEMIPFHSNEENSGAGTFSGFGKAVLGELMIRRMDDVVSDIKSGVVFFLKIDVEGFEPDVLMGAQQTISKFKPGIYIEMTDQWFREKGSSSLKILNYFWELGYDVFLDADRHFEPIGKDNHDRLNTLFQYNVLAELN